MPDIGIPITVHTAIILLCFLASWRSSIPLQVFSHLVQIPETVGLMFAGFRQKITFHGPILHAILVQVYLRTESIFFLCKTFICFPWHPQCKHSHHKPEHERFFLIYTFIYSSHTDRTEPWAQTALCPGRYARVKTTVNTYLDQNKQPLIQLPITIKLDQDCYTDTVSHVYGWTQNLTMDFFLTSTLKCICVSQHPFCLPNHASLSGSYPFLLPAVSPPKNEGLD